MPTRPFRTLQLMCGQYGVLSAIGKAASIHSHSLKTVSVQGGLQA